MCSKQNRISLKAIFLRYVGPLGLKVSFLRDHTLVFMCSPCLHVLSSETYSLTIRTLVAFFLNVTQLLYSWMSACQSILCTVYLTCSLWLSSGLYCHPWTRCSFIRPQILPAHSGIPNRSIFSLSSNRDFCVQMCVCVSKKCRLYILCLRKNVERKAGSYSVYKK